METFFFLVTCTGALGSVWFIVAYQFKTSGKWLGEEAGRFLMADRLVLSSLFLLILANQIFDHWPGREFVTILLYMVYCLFAWWPLRLLYKAEEQQE